MISVQQHDFSVAEEYNKLHIPGKTGAVVTFVGKVRDFLAESATTTKQGDFFLEHYPGMTEKVLLRIVDEAFQRWELQKARVIHRVGKLTPGEQIVFVGVCSPHRAEAFAACEYIIDILKTQAPFWKKEGDNWLAPRASDEQAADRWFSKPVKGS